MWLYMGEDVDLVLRLRVTRVGAFADEVTAFTAFEIVSVTEGVALVAVVGEDGRDAVGDLDGVDCVFGVAGSSNWPG